MPRLKKRWRKDARCASGGYWEDVEKGRERQRRYEQSEKGRERRRHYDQSEEGRERRRRFNAKRLYLGQTYLGTTNQFPVPREAVIEFAKTLRKEHLHGTHE